MKENLIALCLLLLSLLLQGGLSLFLPISAYLDLPLVVATWFALSRGEILGMVGGSLSGWLSEALFGRGIKGVSGLIRLVLGFALGLLGSRFLINGALPRFSLLLTVTVIDTRVFEWIAPSFGLSPVQYSPTAMTVRGSINATVGLVLFALFERHRARTA
ncbi:MAG: hypothetical protein JJE39_01395 [Vicinamibacteria bacterium]|nr:hypothetical protein [Vicinamibacteria bacterium]